MRKTPERIGVRTNKGKRKLLSYRNRSPLLPVHTPNYVCNTIPDCANGGDGRNTVGLAYVQKSFSIFLFCRYVFTSRQMEGYGQTVIFFFAPVFLYTLLLLTSPSRPLRESLLFIGYFFSLIFYYSPL